MKKNVFAALLLGALSFTACKKNETVTTSDKVEINETTDAVEYKVSTDDSSVYWEGGKINGDKHFGTIKISEGTVGILDNKVVNGTFVIDMNTIDAEDLKDDPEKKAKLEGHLKGSSAENADHFFNVEKYPTASFTISEINDEVIKGNLTVKGITKAIEFPAKVVLSDNEVSITSDEFAIDRTEFDVKYNSGKFFEDLGDKAINDDIKIKVTVKAFKL